MILLAGLLAACAPARYGPHARAFARIAEAGADAAERLALLDRQAESDQLLLALAADPSVSLAKDGCEMTGRVCALRVLASDKLCGEPGVCHLEDRRPDPLVQRAGGALRAYAAGLVRLAVGRPAASNDLESLSSGLRTLRGLTGERRRQELLAFVTRGRALIDRLAPELAALTTAWAANARMMQINHLEFTLRWLRRTDHPGLRLLLAHHARARFAAVRRVLDRSEPGTFERMIAAHSLLYEALRWPGRSGDALRTLQALAGADRQ